MRRFFSQETVSSFFSLRLYTIWAALTAVLFGVFFPLLEVGHVSFVSWLITTAGFFIVAMVFRGAMSRWLTPPAPDGP